MLAPTKLADNNIIAKGQSIAITDILRIAGTVPNQNCAGATLILGKKLADDVTTVTITGCSAAGYSANGTFIGTTSFNSGTTTKPYVTTDIAMREIGAIKFLFYPTATHSAEAGKMCVMALASGTLTFN